MADLVRKRQVGGAPLLLGASLATDPDTTASASATAGIIGGASGNAGARSAGAGRRILCDSKGGAGAPDGEGRLRGEGVVGGEGAAGAGAGSGTECGVPEAFGDDEVGGEWGMSVSLLVLGTVSEVLIGRNIERSTGLVSDLVCAVRLLAPPRVFFADAELKVPWYKISNFVRCRCRVVFVLFIQWVRWWCWPCVI